MLATVTTDGGIADLRGLSPAAVQTYVRNARPSPAPGPEPWRSRSPSPRA
jgi:predicted transcriptional regulator